MISSFWTDHDVESMALEAQAQVKIGRCDCVASLGSTTTDTGGNAP